MTKLAIALAEKLKRDRYSQREFAIEIGIKPPCLNMVLNGKRNLTMSIARAIYHKYPDLAEVLLGQ